jgi:hypothetical protein
MRSSSRVVVRRDQDETWLIDVWEALDATDFAQATADFLSKGLTDVRAFLDALPGDGPADTLRGLAVKLEDALKGWEMQAPTERERAALVTKVLALRRAVSSLQKEPRGGAPPG